MKPEKYRTLSWPKQNYTFALELDSASSDVPYYGWFEAQGLFEEGTWLSQTRTKIKDKLTAAITQ